jgi:hypothetical protein
MESVRLLLNSKSGMFPQGLGNSSGQLGRSITDSVSSSLSGYVAAFENMPIHNEDGSGPHAYVPWSFGEQNRNGELGFPGGYHLEFTSGRQMPGMHLFTGVDGWLGSGATWVGKRLKGEV